MHYVTINVFRSGTAIMALGCLRGATLQVLSVITTALLPTSCLATTSHFSCGEPDKQKTDNLRIDWLEQMVSFQHYKSVKVSYWSNNIIQWTHPIISKEYKIGQRSLSVQMNLSDMTLMYSILDSEPVLPGSDQEWALFLPVYMQCKEFF